MIEFCHNIEPFIQPLPHKNPGGDCFACALTAALRHLFPENPPEFDRVWDYFLENYHNSEKKVLSNSWLGMRSALYKAMSDYKIDVACDIVQPWFDPEMGSHAWYHWIPGREYLFRLEGWLRSGWIALSEVDNGGRGPWLPDGHKNGINHLILLDGVKTYWEDVNVDGKLLGKREEYSVHVINSARSGEHSFWAELDQFLYKHGAAGWWLIRRND